MLRRAFAERGMRVAPVDRAGEAFDAAIGAGGDVLAGVAAWRQLIDVNQ